MFKREGVSLIVLGVLEKENDPVWGAPYFSQSKAITDIVRLLSDFRNLNRQMRCKPHQMSKIRKMLLNLKGFKYAM